MVCGLWGGSVTTTASQTAAWKPSKRLHLQDSRDLAGVHRLCFCSRDQRRLGIPGVFQLWKISEAGCFLFYLCFHSPPPTFKQVQDWLFDRGVGLKSSETWQALKKNIEEEGMTEAGSYRLCPCGFPAGNQRFCHRCLWSCRPGFLRFQISGWIAWSCTVRYGVQTKSYGSV